MKGLFWRGDRFSWSPLIIVVIGTLSLVVVDGLWRTLTIPAESLLIFVVVGQMLLWGVVACVFWWRSARPRKSASNGHG
jgi:hypothetical protein